MKAINKKDVNNIFDYQIKFDSKYEIDKELFNLTFDFKIDDWKRIRTKKYWDTIDNLSYENKKQYTLRCVKYYIENFK